MPEVSSNLSTLPKPNCSLFWNKERCSVNLGIWHPFGFWMGFGALSNKSFFSLELSNKCLCMLSADVTVATANTS